MRHKKMAAPCRRMASRSLLQFLSYMSRSTAGSSGLRPFSSSPACRVALQTQGVTERAASPWTLMAAVCLQRLPVISAERNPIEQRFNQLMLEIEEERSVLSDHELRLLEDADKLRRKLAREYDSDDEDAPGEQEIVLARDLEDAWEQKMKNFEPAPRVRADVDKDLTSPQRCLADSLLLLAEHQVAGEKLWLLPQTQWQEGETLRQTAERALASLPATFKATFLGNAPCGVYKFKLPKAARTENLAGIKVFFFKAVLLGDHPPAAPKAPFRWVKKSELQQFLKPAYMMKVERFLPEL